MRYTLSEDIGFCRADGRLVFLDIGKNRYFQLSEAMERDFTAFVDGRDDQVPALRDLVNRRIFVEIQATSRPASPSVLEKPTRSALERASSASKLPIFGLPEVFATVYSTKWQLKHRVFKDILKAADTLRRTRTENRGHGSTRAHEQQLLNAADSFTRARLYVPVATSCLLDSLALLKYLSQRGLPCRVVFGVVRVPFAAHCWVQSGDWVLNDTVGNASGYTAIWML